MSDPDRQRTALIIDFDPQGDAGPVPSPCISVCVMDPQTGLCQGCLRTIDEIMQWGTATDQVKRAVWTEIKRRAEAHFD